MNIGNIKNIDEQSLESIVGKPSGKCVSDSSWYHTLGLFGDVVWGKAYAHKVRVDVHELLMPIWNSVDSSAGRNISNHFRQKTIDLRKIIM